VIEVGVDLSSDMMIIKISPASSLIQRFGRFLRFDERKGRIYIWFEEKLLNSGDYKVYNGELTRKTSNSIQVLLKALKEFSLTSKLRQRKQSIYFSEWAEALFARVFRYP